MWKTERTPHEVGSDQRPCRLEELRIRTKRFDIDAHCWDPSGLYGTGNVTHGHIADGSASSQEDGIHAIVLEHVRPLRCAFLHQAGNIREPVIGVVALC
jgi:hypothetical protein